MISVLRQNQLNVTGRSITKGTRFQSSVNGNRRWLAAAQTDDERQPHDPHEEQGVLARLR